MAQNAYHIEMVKRYWRMINMMQVAATPKVTTEIRERDDVANIFIKQIVSKARNGFMMESVYDNSGKWNFHWVLVQAY